MPPPPGFEMTNEERRRVLGKVRSGVEGRRAAEHLWTGGYTTRAADVARAAFRELLDTAAALPLSDGAKSAVDAWSELESKSLGSSPADSSQDEGVHGAVERYQRYHAGSLELERILMRELRGPLQVRNARLFRAAALFVTLGLGLGATLLISGRPRVVASGELAPEFGAARAVDGIVATEWLLPAAEPGWLELGLRAPRPLSRVRLCNAHHRGFLDRGTQQYRVEVYLGATLLETQTGSFGKIQSGPVCNTLTLEGAPADHVMVHVSSYWALGGGLSEVTLE
jgi:hypothetical protein